jgi:hypothetical protein
MALVALSVAGPDAAADTLPLNHELVPAELRVVNAAELSDWLIVAYPCTPDGYYELAGELGLGLEPYCVIASGEAFTPLGGRLFALRKKDAAVKDPVAALTVEQRAMLPRKPGRLPPLRVDIVDVSDTQRFFAGDRRVVRLDVELPWDRVALHESLGIASVSYDLALEASADTLRASYRRAAFACKSAPAIEVTASGAAPPPAPSCPVVDDRGEVAPSPSAGSPAPAAAVAPAPPRPRYGLFALGAAIASLGLLGVGILWRRRRVSADAGS